MSKTHHDVLAVAAREALAAPSVLNTQPWRWRIDADALELRPDWDRQLTVADPEGRLLVLSCGAALHHARVTITALGWDAHVQRLCDSFSTEVLARIRIVGQRSPGRDELALRAAIARRRTDRRPFGDDAVPDQAMARLRSAVEAEGVHFHRVRLDQMPMLAIAVARAGVEEMANPDYRRELMRWINRPSWSRDGIPSDTTVQQVPRRVPVRNLSTRPDASLRIEPGGDRGAAYAVLYGDDDTAASWLRAGEATSAAMLTAVTVGLSVAPTSDVIEVTATRELVRGLLPEGGNPFLVLRFGIGTAIEEVGRAPRRDPAEMIQGLPVW